MAGHIFERLKMRVESFQVVCLIVYPPTPLAAIKAMNSNYFFERKSIDPRSDGLHRFASQYAIFMRVKIGFIIAMNIMTNQNLNMRVF